MSKNSIFILVALGALFAAVLSSCEKVTKNSPSPSPALAPTKPIEVTTSNPPSTAEVAPTVIANLAKFKNLVSFRRAQDLAWNDVKGLVPFYRQDAIHTLADSEALISYASGSEISMKENTYLIIDEPSKNDGGPRIDRAVMRDGKLEGETSGEMWILTSAALVKLKAKEKIHTAKIKIQIKEKATLDLQLKSGDGEVLIAQADKGQASKAPQEARSIHLKENKSVSISLKETTSETFGYKTESTDWLETVKVIKEALQNSPQPPPKEEVKKETAPFLQIESPANKAHTNEASIIFSGNAGPTGAQLKINGKSCSINATSHFSCEASLDLGLNLFVLQLTSPEGKTIFQKWMQTRTSQ